MTAELNGLRSAVYRARGGSIDRAPKILCCGCDACYGLARNQCRQAQTHTDTHTLTHAQSSCLLAHLWANYGSAALATATAPQPNGTAKRPPLPRCHDGAPPGLGHKIRANHRLIAPHTTLAAHVASGRCGCHSPPSLLSPPRSLSLYIVYWFFSCSVICSKSTRKL